MRKITEDSIGTFLARRPFKQANMEVRVDGIVGDGSTSVLLLHDNEIAKLYSDGSIDVTNAGWFTPTTKDRLNGIPGVSVTQKKGVWYLNGVEWEVTFPYFMAHAPMKFPTEAAARVFVEVQQSNAA